MSRRLLCCAVLLSFACAKQEEAPAPPPAPPGPPPISLADVAGNWQIRVNSAAGDSVLGFTLLATSDTSGWTMTMPGNRTVPVRVLSVAGDSIVTEAGPYPSALRRGQQVRTHSIFRLHDGELRGTTHATYNVNTADSVATLNSVGRRAAPTP